MVISPEKRRGWITTDLVVAMVIIVIGIIPVAITIYHDQRATRILYHRAIAMALVDGEFEALAAGQWRAFQPGTHDYPVTGAAAANLPEGAFTLTLTDSRMQLEWKPVDRGRGGPVVRRMNLPPRQP